MADPVRMKTTRASHVTRRPTAGRALINGGPVASVAGDAHTLGVYIEPTGAYPGRS